MQAVSFIGCFCTGHGCFPPRPAISGSPDTYVNGINVLLAPETWFAVHCCPGNGCHPAPLATGNPTVLVNSLPIGRIGDLVGCGSLIAEGSFDTYA